MAAFQKSMSIICGSVFAASVTLLSIGKAEGGAADGLPIPHVGPASSAVGQIAPVANASAAENVQNEPFCGILCLYAELRLARSTVSVRSLLRPENLSSDSGSSIEMLERVAKENGLFALSAVGLSRGDLASCEYPALLHVRARSNPREYNHFVLFLGVAGTDAIVFDPETLLAGGRCPLDELVQRWDGEALLVSTKPIDAAPLVNRGRERLFAWALAAGCAAIVVRRLTGARQNLGCFAPIRFCSRQPTSAVIVLVFGARIGLILNTFSNAGLLSGSPQASLIDGAYAGQFLPSLTTTQVAAMVKVGNVTLVDARLTRDFESGHLPGAVSIPPGSSKDVRRAVLAPVSPGAPIIIYCQSVTCPFSEKLASDLLADGFSNLSLYRGGWEEWSLSQ